MPTPFFTAAGLSFFKERLKKRKYRKDDAQDRADVARIKKEIFDPTNEWARAVARQLPGYAVQEDNRFLTGFSSLKNYSWARLYLRELGDRDIYITLGVGGDDELLIYKIDTQHGRSTRLTAPVIALLKGAIEAAGPDVGWNEIDLENNPQADWAWLIEKTVTFVKRQESLFRRLHKLLPVTVKEREKMTADFAAKFPNPNIILYGPPGTGKTRHTLELAYEILKGEAPPDYAAAKALFQEEQGKRLEFVTFHQSFTYEDFVQGIRPDTSEKGELTFKRHDGIFYKIAQRARDEFNQRAQADRPSRVPFDTVFAHLVAPLAEREEEVAMPMNKAGYSFHLIELGEDYLRFRRHDQGTESSLNLATLRALYDGTIEYKQGGLQLYYKYIVEKLEQLAVDIKREGPGAHPQSNFQQADTDEAAPPRTYVLIIDEINRANISKVFGELITLLEKDKRLGGENPLAVTLPSGEGKFTVPANLYLIGTMNTADKSIALLDIALRRRFEFRALYPRYSLGAGAEATPIPHADVLRRLNEEIVKVKSRDFQIGHAYFLDKDETLPHIFNHKVIPLLYEYFLNDEKKVKKLLEDAKIQVEQHPDTGLLRYPEPGAPAA